MCFPPQTLIHCAVWVMRLLHLTGIYNHYCFVSYSETGIASVNNNILAIHVEW